MLYYESLVISKDINPAKSNKSKEGMFCHFWFFSLAESQTTSR